MAVFTFANNVQTNPAAPITSGATTITLSSSANLPATIPAGQYLEITLNDAATGAIFEIMYATVNLGSGQLQVLRGQEGTTARSWGTNDKVYSCASAGVLASFLNSGATGNFVQLSPAVRQTGSILVSGNINTNGAGQFGGGVVVGGSLTNATSGAFSADVTALDHIASRAYTNTSLANMPLRVQGSGGVIGIGPSSGLSAQGITASALAVGLAGSANFIAVDNAGNLGATGNLKATSGIFSSQVTAPTVLQGGVQVLDALTSSGGTLTITGSGATRNLEVASTGAIPIGGIIPQDGSGSTGSCSVPGYGQWRVRVNWNFGAISDNNASQGIFLTSGSVSGAINSSNYVSQNATYYGLASYGALCPSSTAQNLSFSFTSTLGTTNSHWTIDLIRVA